MTRFERMKELGPGESGHAICDTMDCEDCPWFKSLCMDENDITPMNGWEKWLKQKLKDTEDI